MKKYYECYSYNQMKFLSENGEHPIKVSIHNKTKRTFWIYKIIDNDNLSKLLKEWSMGKSYHLIAV
ncbi:hypothetical protein R0K17_09560 [Planococcus sp. SIMBA_143]